jgi:hypothetical protein
MNKLKQYWAIIIIIVVIVFGLFYWFQWRPSHIKIECYKTADWWSKGSGWAFNYHYRQCLRSKGL